jgi:septal ring factor EnvC (AmiA/AmiB activator)
LGRSAGGTNRVETLARSVPSELVEDGDTSITAVVTGGGVTSEVIQALLASAMQSAMAPLLDELKEVRQQLTTSEQQQQAVIQQLKSTIDSQAAALAQMEARLQNQVNEVRQEVVATLQVQEERRQAEAERDRPVMQAISERLEKRSLWERLLRRS